MTIAADYPFLDVLWTMLVFFGWVIWFWLLIIVFGDVFRRHDISGWGKAGWTLDSGPSGQIAQAKRLLDEGAIDRAEYEQIKSKALS